MSGADWKWGRVPSAWNRCFTGPHGSSTGSSWGVIAAAFINGPAMLMAVYHPLGWEPWMGVFFAFGFVAAAVLSIYLAWNILWPRGGWRRSWQRRCWTVGPSRSTPKLSEAPARPDRRDPKGLSVLWKGALAPAASVLFAFVASHHHSLHMVLLTFGISTAASSLLVNPFTHRLMLLLSVIAVLISMYQFWYQRRLRAMRIAGSFSILVTISLLAWSISQFGA